MLDTMFEYHTFLHHSQTKFSGFAFQLSLSTIRFYIILKHIVNRYDETVSLSTIRFYIILKPQSSKMQCLIRTGHGTQTFFS